MTVRRGTGAVRSCFDFCLVQKDLPDELYEHPNLDRLILLAEEVIIYTNVSRHVLLRLWVHTKLCASKSFHILSVSSDH